MKTDLKGETRMEENIRELLSEAIKNEIANLSRFNPESKEHGEIIDNLTKLYRLRIEESKSDWEYSERYETRLAEEERRKQEDVLKSVQLEEQEKDRYIKIGIEAAGIILPLIFYASWMRKGFRFEETGTFTSTTFRGLFQKFKPTKK